MALPTVQQLHDRVGNPELSHWNAAETFTLIEAAFLTIGADPLDWGVVEIESLKNADHPNWRHAALLLRSLKEGVCTGEIICIDVYVKEYYDQWQNWNPEQVDAMNLSPGQADAIVESMTKISRKSLYDWYKRKSLIRQTLSPVQKNSRTTQASDVQTTIVENNPTPLMLAPPDYMDSNNPMSPEELRAGHDAWYAVTKDGDPRESGQAIKAAVRKYLDDHPIYGLLSNEAKSRICISVNWNPKGGSTRTPTKSTIPPTP